MVLGAPTHEGSPFVPGSRFGPRSIREHPLRFTNGYFDPGAGRRHLEREMRDHRIAHHDSSQAMTVPDFRSRGPAGVAVLLPKGARCYISLDIDVLDPSLVRGCVSAEPDGMSYSQLKEALIALADRARVVGFDLVEVNPQLDAGQVPPRIWPPTPSWSSLATCATARDGRPSASALQAPRHQGDQVVEDVGGGNGSNLGVVVGRRDLDYVASDDSHCIEPAQ